MNKVYFENSQGDKLCGILSGEGKRVVVMAHGLASSKESEKYVRLQELLNSKGIATLRFDFFGHGESEGEYKDFNISEGKNDVLCAIEFVRGEGFEEVGLIGSSIGGISCIMAASEVEDLKFLGLVAPVCCPEELPVIEEHEDARKLRTPVESDTVNNGYKVAGKIKVSTLIIHGDGDILVPIEQSRKMSKLLSDCKLIEIPGADHRFTKDEDYQKVIELLDEFTSRSLTGAV